MNGFRFFVEMPEARKSKSASKAYPHQPWTRATMRRYAEQGKRLNVCAVFTDPRHSFGSRGVPMVECISAVYDHENSDVTMTAASRDYLSTRCVSIDEATARKLHPALFRRLDD